MLGDARRSVVSSANSDVLGEAAGRSLAYKIKRRGPRMEPWGTPDSTVVSAEDVPCVTNLCYDYDLRMSLYLVLVLWSPVSDVIYGLGVRVSMV